MLIFKFRIVLGKFIFFLSGNSKRSYIYNKVEIVKYMI